MRWEGGGGTISVGGVKTVRALLGLYVSTR